MNSILILLSFFASLIIFYVVCRLAAVAVMLSYRQIILGKQGEYTYGEEDEQPPRQDS